MTCAEKLPSPDGEGAAGEREKKRLKHMNNKPLFVRVEWDEEAGVWVATSDDVPGLATEKETLEGLIEKLKILIPELLEANGAMGEEDVPFEVLTRRFEIAHRLNS
jgi:predicted RNase H-like HicB family nuclease